MTGILVILKPFTYQSTNIWTGVYPAGSLVALGTTPDLVFDIDHFIDPQSMSPWTDIEPGLATNQDGKTLTDLTGYVTFIDDAHPPETEDPNLKDLLLLLWSTRQAYLKAQHLLHKTLCPPHDGW